MRKLYYKIFYPILFLLPIIVIGSQDTARTSSDWIKEGIVYEIFPRHFGPNGTFIEIESRIPQIKELGLTILWLMPIHPIGQINRKGTLGSPYSVQDYYSINSVYGTSTDLVNLIQSAHSNGMKVILDLVANHTAWDHDWITSHKEYYHQDSTGNIISPNTEWTDVAWLDYSNSTVRLEMLNIMKYWVNNFDIDGYRCDVSGLIPLDFWETARNELEQLKPEILFLSESDIPDFHKEAFDMSYSWKAYDSVRDVLQEVTTLQILEPVITQEKADFPLNTLFLRFLDNHDLWRASIQFDQNRWKAGAAFLFLVPGVPLIYNGQEIGDTTLSHGGYLFEKDEIEWSLSTTSSAMVFYNHYKDLINYRKANPALQSNQIQFIANDQPDKVISFIREKGNNQIIVAINFTNQAVNAIIQYPLFKSDNPIQVRNLKNPKEYQILNQPRFGTILQPYEYSLWIIQGPTSTGVSNPVKGE